MSQMPGNNSHFPLDIIERLFYNSLNLLDKEVEMTTYPHNPLGNGIRNLWNSLIHNRKFNRGAAWGMMIVSALLAFEIFNFSTTQYALHDMLGDLKFAGFRWATILAIAFCGIDFAGIARLFTPEQGRDEPAEVYYLFGAWLLAAGFNATLTWWGVSVAIINNGNLQSSAVMSVETLTKAVPIFVAVMVWLVRLLIIGTFSLAGERIFTTAQSQQSQYQTQRPVNQPVNQPALRPASQINRPANSPASFRPAPIPTTSQQSSFIPPDPTYHPVSHNARSSDSGERRYDA